MRLSWALITVVACIAILTAPILAESSKPASPLHLQNLAKAVGLNLAVDAPASDRLTALAMNHEQCDSIVSDYLRRSADAIGPPASHRAMADNQARSCGILREGMLAIMTTSCDEKFKEALVATWNEADQIVTAWNAEFNYNNACRA